MKRKEDRCFLTGRRYSDDVRPEGTLRLAVLCSPHGRSPNGQARILSVRSDERTKTSIRTPDSIEGAYGKLSVFHNVPGQKNRAFNPHRVLSLIQTGQQKKRSIAVL